MKTSKYKVATYMIFGPVVLLAFVFALLFTGALIVALFSGGDIGISGCIALVLVPVCAWMLAVLFLHVLEWSNKP